MVSLGVVSMADGGAPGVEADIPDVSGFADDGAGRYVLEAAPLPGELAFLALSR